LRAETDKTNARILNVRGDYTYKRGKKGYIAMWKTARNKICDVSKAVNIFRRNKFSEK